MDHVALNRVLLAGLNLRDLHRSSKTTFWKFAKFLLLRDWDLLGELVEQLF